MNEQGLRKDAERNRERLLEAGRKVFAERGLGASLNDVAKAAGVGVGTAYRRFANKDELIDAIFVRQVDELGAILNESLADEDAWRGLVNYLEGTLAIQARDRGMAQILSGSWASLEEYNAQRARLAPLVNRLADRARETGVVRADLTGTDLIFLQIGLTAIATTARDGADHINRADAPELYRRYLGVFLDGIREPATRTELPIPALSTDDTHALLRQTVSGDDVTE
ncbi:TetR/AcrR family transcriptional regulator [Gulosibacter sp. ACHW.36C]|uniref:TetR/AcrR family transcriptional regulator n=1 Tax=Gulosibacter sediminis TaxID=1729695 RepID=A0ABY4MYV6_9MICO|nr:TetR family transcriptional regulator [Gulosibacter sediminis]UQN15620.1 TetR/AcrR family transcriptional regulator [Gulosibacter sediminis]